jgi:hypothetical protein
MILGKNKGRSFLANNILPHFNVHQRRLFDGVFCEDVYFLVP